MKNKGSDDITMQVRLDNNTHFEKVFNRFYASVLFLAKKYMNDRDEAQDIAMDSFRKLWENRFDFNNYGSVHRWLITSTRNACINRLKQLNRIQKKEEQIEYSILQASHEKTIEQCLIDAEVIRIIMDEVEKLPKKCRRIFAMHIGGQGNKEIAGKLNLSPNTVKNQVARASKILKLNLKDIESPVLLLICIACLQD